MQAIDKLKSDIDDWARRAGKPRPGGSAPGNADFDALRATFARSIPKLPEDTLAALFTTFLSRYAQGEPARAVDWLCGVGSLLLQDYDGTEFTRDEWNEIREIMTLDSGEIDMDLLSYVLEKVLDHGGL